MAKKKIIPAVEENTNTGSAVGESATAPTTEESVKDSSPKDVSKNISKVIFTRKDGSKREFNETVHGEGFIALADEFEKTNAKFIYERENL